MLDCRWRIQPPSDGRWVQLAQDFIAHIAIMGLISGDFDPKVTHMIGHLLDLLLQKLLCGLGVQTVIGNRGNPRTK